MKQYKFLLLSLLALFLLNSCESDDSFGNKVSLTSATKVTTLLIKPANVSAVEALQVEMPHPQSYEIHLKYEADTSLVKKYNEAFYDNAKLLPASFYEIPVPYDTVNVGTVRSIGKTIHFKDINLLSRDTVYVLPVTITNINASTLESANTHYYVFKGAALINVVADLEENALGAYTSWNNPSALRGITEITMEALVRARNYDRMISTVMGVEGRFLIRLGDAGFPSNQIQVATNRGNFPGSDANKGLPLNTWTHIAVTCNTASGAVKVYVNGRVQSEGTISGLGTLDMTASGTQKFYIGRSYEDSRYFAGEFSECRIWNVVRTQEEIESSIYEVDPTTPGLVAYWKCDDGAGNTVTDYTANENHLTSRKTVIKWNPVSLP
ncbi:DUF1735 and LamG domain-containing protein [Dysgonomonas sp. 25]|uniref:DUF1735 and LamG domain-containing protein n=1 Tax=Dysgonomonas sp. 25 TaxID=2302933 RepID=UPI0013D13070|nr:DUF1735 and LamG domain-containing protein [Dysgonomonas sp. 25]